eukprot:CAMPEP_0172508898 /NCGR_PEP_ID=MMETSP1066-20121228/215803_1 /TAXON_ID=671091 /ORGANISM="Coscinodiscus wailesii, Strain CCMP2513" /LENGTH=33 /DNA_ID= /DNA_START= /DNA_END= /DNA_ORIENTATION=
MTRDFASRRVRAALPTEVSDLDEAIAKGTGRYG